MNTRPRSMLNGWLMAFLFLLLVNVGLAQTPGGAPPVPASLPDQIVAILTPILVPLLLAVVKQFVPRLPTFVIPLLAPVLGFLIGLVNTALGHSSNLWVAAGLGLLGVAVREVKETLKPATNGGWPELPPGS